jgi:hypothetical protein
VEEIEHWKNEVENARQLFNQQEEQIRGTFDFEYLCFVFQRKITTHSTYSKPKCSDTYFLHHHHHHHHHQIISDYPFLKEQTQLLKNENTELVKKLQITEKKYNTLKQKLRVMLK